LELCATKTTSASEAARCIYEKYYMRHGFVPNIISDRAQSFLANLTQELFKICKIRSIKTSGFHPHMNGIAEIQNKSLIIALRTHLMQQRTDWTRQIPSVAFAHNISVLPNLSVSPFVIIYNREPRLPIDAQTLQAVASLQCPVSLRISLQTSIFYTDRLLKRRPKIATSRDSISLPEPDHII
jgi:hypothetical protein